MIFHVEFEEQNQMLPADFGEVQEIRIPPEDWSGEAAFEVTVTVDETGKTTSATSQEIYAAHTDGKRVVCRYVDNLEMNEFFFQLLSAEEKVCFFSGQFNGREYIIMISGTHAVVSKVELVKEKDFSSMVEEYLKENPPVKTDDTLLMKDGILSVNTEVINTMSDEEIAQLNAIMQ